MKSCEITTVDTHRKSPSLAHKLPQAQTHKPNTQAKHTSQTHKKRTQGSDGYILVAKDANSVGFFLLRREAKGTVRENESARDRARVNEGE